MQELRRPSGKELLGALQCWPLPWPVGDGRPSVLIKLEFLLGVRYGRAAAPLPLAAPLSDAESLLYNHIRLHQPRALSSVG